MSKSEEFLSLFQQGKELKVLGWDETSVPGKKVSIPFSAGQRVKGAWIFLKRVFRILFLSLFQQGKELKIVELDKLYKKPCEFLSLFQQGKELKSKIRSFFKWL